MQRRTFIRNTALCAVAVSASGFIRFDGHQYIGDCETTSDILGPFYRPDSPVRNNLVIPGEKGQLLQLSGTIKHSDCKTPYKNAKIELWHCDGKGVYDNDSADYRYRATNYCDDKGQYSFTTILPVPYEVGGRITRPAHFHIMVTAEGYQPLVTQLYFSGDPNIATDATASSPLAKRRILTIKTTSQGIQKVLYDVSMTQRLAAEPSAIQKLTGTYINEKDPGKKMELFMKGNVLWEKNPLFGVNYDYTGNNTFEYPGLPPGFYSTLQFKMMEGGIVQLTQNYMDEKKVKHTEVFRREM